MQPDRIISNLKKDLISLCGFGVSISPTKTGAKIGDVEFSFKAAEVRDPDPDYAVQLVAEISVGDFFQTFVSWPMPVDEYGMPVDKKLDACFIQRCAEAANEKIKGGNSVLRALSPQRVPLTSTTRR